jgi:hypothetical protein
MLFIVIRVLLFIYYSVVPHTAAHCRTVPCVVFCYLFIIIYLLFGAAHCRTHLPRTAALCRTLLHTAAHCRMLFIVVYS